MSDNRRVHLTMKRALKQLYPTEPQGNLARHLHTLAAMASGIVRSRSTNLPDIAGKIPDGTKKESRVKKFHRWIKNERIGAQVYFLPYVNALLNSLAEAGPLLLAMDSSEVGRDCLTLMISVIYKKRALPIPGRGRQPRMGLRLPHRQERPTIGIAAPFILALPHCSLESQKVSI